MPTKRVLKKRLQKRSCNFYAANYGKRLDGPANERNQHSAGAKTGRSHWLPERLADFRALPSVFYAQGRQVSDLAIFEVSWFDRPDEVREQVAEIIRDTAQALQYPLVQVIFTTLYQERFYEFEM